MKQNIENILSSGLTRNHKTWISIIQFIVRKLSSVTSSKVEIGSYWANDEGNTGGFCSRVKSYTGLRDTNSDYWEASVCLSFSDQAVWANAELFLFKNGKVLSKTGVVENNSDRAGEFYHFIWENNTWKDQGWSFSDGPGEWGSIEKSGDCYFTKDIKPIAQYFRYKQPVCIKWPLSKFFLIDSVGTDTKNSGYCWISPVLIKRDKENRNLSVYSGSLPKVKDANIFEFREYSNGKNREIEIDITRWSISGGWKPGRYYLILRLQFFFSPQQDERIFHSDISTPIKLEIKEQ